MATGPVYMNATPHHSKVRVTLALSSSLFVAGQDVTGKMEMECRADKEVGIGLMMVELFAVQELNSRDHSASSTFLHTRRLFQGPGLPPSNAVNSHPTPGEPPLPQGYFPSRRGTTSFFFQFPLPLSSPSSISFASGLAKVRYEVRASVSVAHRGEKRVVTDVAETDIVQCEDMDGISPEHVVIGENGKMYVQGRIAGGRIISGQQACLELHVKNHSSKTTTGLSLTLTRVLRLHNAATVSQAPLQLTDTLYSHTFRGTEYSVQAGTEGVANLVFDVPKAARVVKGGIREGADDGVGGRRRTEPLFEIQCMLGVKIGMGIGHKDVLFEMQVQLSHPATLPDSIPTSEPYASPAPDTYAANAAYTHQNSRAMSPVFQLPNPHFARSPGPGSGTSSPPYPYASPSTSSPPPQQYYHSSSPIPPYAYAGSPHQHLWSPPPPAVSPLSYYIPNAQQAYFFPPPPVALLPFAYPTRPSSAGAGYQHNIPPASGLPRGLPGVEAMGPYPAYDDHLQQNVISFNSHPHPNSQSETPVDAGGEEGKGERASRISHHLQISTRARSMSPTSHRFPTASSVLPPTGSAFHATSPRHQDSPTVLSPRPMPSPRNSFPAHAVVEGNTQETHGTARSGRVDLLERLVDLAPGEEGKSVEDVLKDLERVEKEMDKTLPNPPVPSGKAEAIKKVSNVPRVNEVFGLQAPKGKVENTREDNSKKSVLRPSPMPRRISTHEMDREQSSRSHDKGNTTVGALRPSSEQHSSGLDALEKRLLLEVGTRKPNASDRPTVFELGIAAPMPAVPLSNSAPTHPEAGDSEISNLTLASNDSTDHYFYKGGKRVSSASKPVHVPRIGGEKVKMERSAQAVAADKDRSPVMQKEYLKGNNREQEAMKLRKAAKGRVADWLGAIATRPVPDNADRGPNPLPLAESGSTEKMSPVGETSNDKISANVSIPSSPRGPFLQPVDAPANAKKSWTIGDPTLRAGSSSPSVDPKPLGKPLSTPAVFTPALSTASTSAPSKVPSPVSPRLRKPVPPLDEPISEGSQSVSTPIPEPEKVAALPTKFLLPQGIPGTKYDIRSARGGKGGITTSVAALWTTLAQEGEKDNQAKRPTKPVTRKPVTYPAFLDVGKSKPSPAFTDASPNSTSNITPTPISPVSSATEPPQSRNAVKSVSDPAAVVPSHARPYLSSTASLARPPPPPLSRAKPPMLSSTLSEAIPGEPAYKVSPPIPRDMAFGQARLKDLIKKYQQSAP